MMEVIGKIFKTNASLESLQSIVFYPRIIPQGTRIYPLTYLVGSNFLDANNFILHSYLEGVTLEEGCQIIFSYLFQSKIGKGSRIKGGWVEDSQIGDQVLIGPGAVLKRAIIGSKVHIPHQCYLADVEIGEGTNIAVGVYTCNFNGVEKHKTLIEANCFIGTGVHLLAPCEIGEEVYIAERVSVKSRKKIPSHSLVVGVGKNYEIKEDRSFCLDERTWVLTHSSTSPLLMREIKELFSEIKKKRPGFSVREYLATPQELLGFRKPVELLKEFAAYKGMTGAPALKDFLKEFLRSLG